MTRTEAEAKLRAFIRHRVDRSKAKSRVEITESITYAVQDWLRWMGAVSCQREVPISYEMDGKRLKGRIDVVGQWKSGGRAGRAWPWRLTTRRSRAPFGNWRF